jgi:GNAT superfamily N-acetyltransferase
MADWRIERLAHRHDRGQFDCGRPPLNDWLRRLAGQYERRDLSRTYVATRPGESVALGYYALSYYSVGYEALPEDQAKGLPRIDVPVALLRRLAVDRSAQGRGLEAFLLIDALRRADHLSRQIGIRAVAVHAADETARNFYLKYGFTSLTDAPRHLFPPMRAIRRLRLPPLEM